MVRLLLLVRETEGLVFDLWIDWLRFIRLLLRLRPVRLVMRSIMMFITSLIVRFFLKHQVLAVEIHDSFYFVALYHRVNSDPFVLS